MKPLRFDMTQVANALKAPEITARDLPQTPAEPEAEAIFPQHYMRGRSWVATMAYEQIHALATHILARHGELGMRTLAITSALGHPARLRVVAMLQGGELCACQITEVLGLASSRCAARLSVPRWMSRSTTRTRLPELESLSASASVTVVLPSPARALVIARVRIPSSP